MFVCFMALLSEFYFFSFFAKALMFTWISFKPRCSSPWKFESSIEHFRYIKHILVGVQVLTLFVSCVYVAYLLNFHEFQTSICHEFWWWSLPLVLKFQWGVIVALNKSTLPLFIILYLLRRWWNFYKLK